jgi:hypothetical protein
VDDSDFNESEHLLIVEVAHSLEPRLGEIIRTWTTAILRYGINCRFEIAGKAAFPSF